MQDLFDNMHIDLFLTKDFQVQTKQFGGKHLEHFLSEYMTHKTQGEKSK